MLKKIDCSNFNTIYMTKSIEEIYKTFFTNKNGDSYEN